MEDYLKGIKDSTKTQTLRPAIIKALELLETRQTCTERKMGNADAQFEIMHEIINQVKEMDKQNVMRDGMIVKIIEESKQKDLRIKQLEYRHNEMRTPLERPNGTGTPKSQQTNFSSLDKTPVTMRYKHGTGSQANTTAMGRFLSNMDANHTYPEI